MAGFALCIGINDYPGTGSDLSGCVNDANDWAKELERRDFSVTRLLDGAATGEAITSAIEEVVGQAGKRDVVVITYSGHGSFVPDEDGDEPDGTDECICPHDVATRGAITDDTLFTLYSASAPGAKVIVISDSCHSGTVARYAPITTPPATRGARAPQRKVRFLPPAHFLRGRQLASLGRRRRVRSSGPPGRHAALLMAGCQDAEYSFDSFFNGKPNGAFSFIALEELAKLPANATYTKWFRAIQARLPSQQYPQSPNLFGTKAMKRWRVFR